METVADFIFLGSKITADGDCSHKIKRHLLLGKKAMTNLDSILKSRDKGLHSQRYGFSNSHVWMWKLDVFELRCWSFSFGISLSSEYSGLISFGINWFDLLAVQGVLKSLLQCHNLKASILWLSAFFTPSLTSIHKAQFCPLLAVCLWTTNVTHLSSGK